MSTQKNRERDNKRETAKVNKECKNMVLHKEIVDELVVIKNTVRRNINVSRYRFKNDHIITVFICATFNKKREVRKILNKARILK